MKESDYLEGNIEFLEKLKQMPNLGLFEEKDLKGLLRLSKVRTYEPGELILEEGLYDCWIYFLVSGKARVVKHEEDLNILKRPGDLFGEMGVIDGLPRSACVYAVDETVCLATDSSYIDRLSGNNKLAFCYLLYRTFAEFLADRLRVTTQKLVEAKGENKRLRNDD